MGIILIRIWAKKFVLAALAEKQQNLRKIKINSFNRETLKPLEQQNLLNCIRIRS